MIVGVTGTSKGMTNLQLSAAVAWFRATLWRSHIVEGHHGDCVGVDRQFDALAGHPGVSRGAHPADNSKLRAHCKAQTGLKPKPYLVRNDDIAAACDVLLAAPEGPERSHPRSGTWSTVRRARKRSKRVIIFWPDGRVTEEE